MAYPRTPRSDAAQADVGAMTDIAEAIEYDPVTGSLVWVSGRRSGKPAGYLHPDGYRRIKCDGTTYAAHRIAWRIFYGQWPAGLQLDHINGVRDDNRIDNLRLATSSQNCANSGPRGKHLKGVTRHREGKFQAQIKTGGKGYYLGLFENEADANAAYLVKARELFGEFARGS